MSILAFTEENPDEGSVRLVGGTATNNGQVRTHASYMCTSLPQIAEGMIAVIAGIAAFCLD